MLSSIVSTLAFVLIPLLTELRGHCGLGMWLTVAFRFCCRPGLNPLSFDPSSNNEPLQFGGSNGPLVTDCPLENGAENSKKRKRPNLPPEGIRNIAMESSPMGMPMSDPNAWATAMNNLGMAPMGLAGQPLLPDPLTSADVSHRRELRGHGHGKGRRQ
ncbi:hypothetical protein SKAU_G00375220 [Synaphobranchus kaupii]|uniref:Uncharacterized protein n=1 Tax=Synaphobranchus kaupii TaxID=118154 RepID=A0A9Q1EGU8_SYNKA|nr:hypothetical protein SKAU_G00375220 [Synaphobranchus kaupii]